MSVDPSTLLTLDAIVCRLGQDGVLSWRPGEAAKSWPLGTRPKNGLSNCHGNVDERDYLRHVGYNVSI
jgi:hypothetical protein